MDGSARPKDGRTITYCLVPPDLAGELHDSLRRHFRQEPSVEVVVERRREDRRRKPQRRASASAHSDERRRVKNSEGRRVADRRGPALTVEPPTELPPEAGPHADRIVFVQRVGPSSERAEDIDSARLV